MDKYEITTNLIKNTFKVNEMLYLIDGIDKNPIYLVWDIASNKYVLVTYYNEKLINTVEPIACEKNIVALTEDERKQICF